MLVNISVFYVLKLICTKATVRYNLIDLPKPMCQFSQVLLQILSNWKQTKTTTHTKFDGRSVYITLQHDITSLDYMTTLHHINEYSCEIRRRVQNSQEFFNLMKISKYIQMSGFDKIKKIKSCNKNMPNVGEVNNRRKISSIHIFFFVRKNLKWARIKYVDKRTFSIYLCELSWSLSD